MWLCMKDTEKEIPVKLPSIIKHARQGYEYSQIAREGNVALYEARYLNGSELRGFVVAKIRIKNATTMPSGKFMPKREKFPSRSDFGKYGWFFSKESRSEAEEYYQQLLSKTEDRGPNRNGNDATEIGAREGNI